MSSYGLSQSTVIEGMDSYPTVEKVNPNIDYNFK
jgi:hypothetical protein